jgi:hypothetical protein
MWKVAMLPQSCHRYSHGLRTVERRSANEPPQVPQPKRSALRPRRVGRRHFSYSSVAPRASDCYDGPAPLEGPMSSKRRRFDRRGVDPGLALIVGIAVGTALVLLLASWWR